MCEITCPKGITIEKVRLTWVDNQRILKTMTKKQKKHISLSSVFTETHLTVTFRPIAEGGYEVIIPALPEICTYGRTLRQAEVMAKDAIRCYLESEWKLMVSERSHARRIHG